MQKDIYDDISKVTRMVRFNADIIRFNNSEVNKIKDRLTDVTWYEIGSPALDTNYQNTRGKVIFVTVAVATAGGAGDILEAHALVGASSPPTEAVAHTRVSGDEEPGRASMTFPVPVNWYYQIYGNVNTDGLIAELWEWALH